MIALLVFAILFTLLGALLGFFIWFAEGMSTSPPSTGQLMRALTPAWVLYAIAALFWILWATG